jgi:hypothetical protein
VLTDKLNMVSENSLQLTRRIAAPRHNYDKAIRNNTGVTINRYHFWAAPILVEAMAEYREVEHLEEAAALMREIVYITQQTLAIHPDNASLTTKDKTRLITYTIRKYFTSLDADYSIYAELHIPFRPGSSSHPGRVDLAVLRRGKPDILIEIDHEPKATSEEKLRFIASQGGIGLWIRWDAWGASAIY